MLFIALGYIPGWGGLRKREGAKEGSKEGGGEGGKEGGREGGRGDTLAWEVELSHPPSQHSPIHSLTHPLTQK